MTLKRQQRFRSTIIVTIYNELTQRQTFKRVLGPVACINTRKKSFCCFSVKQSILAKVFVLQFEAIISKKRRPYRFYCFSVKQSFLARAFALQFEAGISSKRRPCNNYTVKQETKFPHLTLKGEFDPEKQNEDLTPSRKQNRQ